MQDISLNAYKLYKSNNATYIQQIKHYTVQNIQLIEISDSPKIVQSVNDLLIDAIVMSILTGIGLTANMGSIFMILRKKSTRKIINLFYLHHCLINFFECLFFIPFIVSVIFQFEISNGCSILSSGCCILITANVLNIVI
jgi:hypothetical protein